jgi:hypothetical protein
MRGRDTIVGLPGLTPDEFHELNATGDPHDV